MHSGSMLEIRKKTHSVLRQTQVKSRGHMTKFTKNTGLGLKTTAREFLLYLCPQTSSCLSFIFFPNGHFDPFCREPTTNNLPAKTHQANIFGMLQNKLSQPFFIQLIFKLLNVYFFILLRISGSSFWHAAGFSKSLFLLNLMLKRDAPPYP